VTHRRNDAAEGEKMTLPTHEKLAAKLRDAGLASLDWRDDVPCANPVIAEAELCGTYSIRAIWWCDGQRVCRLDDGSSEIVMPGDSVTFGCKDSIHDSFGQISMEASRAMLNQALKYPQMAAAAAAISEALNTAK
jgi:hypothetical protein